MCGIKNISIYNSKMSEAIKDKIEFIRRVNWNKVDVVLDFGCADGTLSRKIALTTGKPVVGYDQSDEMIGLANKRNKSAMTDFGNNLSDICESLRNKRVLVLMSSVLHEIYSYSYTWQIDNMWNTLKKLNIEYFVIRDMYFRSKHSNVTSDSDYEKVKALSDKKMLDDFEAKQGSIKELDNMVQFLLKRNYKENWEREVKENYFACKSDDSSFKRWFELDILHSEEFNVPFIRNGILKEYGIDLNDLCTTHRKLILTKAENIKREA